MSSGRAPTEFDLLVYLQNPTAYVILAGTPEPAKQKDASFSAMQTLSEVLHSVSTGSTVTRTERILTATEDNPEQRRLRFETLLTSIIAMLSDREKMGNLAVKNTDLGDFLVRVFNAAKAAEEARKLVTKGFDEVRETIQQLSRTTREMSEENDADERTDMQTEIHLKLEQAGERLGKFVDLLKSPVISSALDREAKLYGVSK